MNVHFSRSLATNAAPCRSRSKSKSPKIIQGPREEDFVAISSKQNTGYLSVTVNIAIAAKICRWRHTLSP